MKKIYLILLSCITIFTVNAQISITANGTAFTQDFNSLASTGTAAITTLPLGWTFIETGTGANTTYTADNGSTASGNTYSYGTAVATDRAFGTLLSGSVTSTIGASFTNNTGVTVGTIDISFIGEQWRIGALGRQDRLEFQYSTNATSLTTGTYIAVAGLNFIAPISIGTVGPLDGNLAANRTAVTASITGLNIPAGATFWIKWNDPNVTGADDGLAIDDFSITTTAAPADVTPPTVTTLTPADNATNVSPNTNLQILFNEPIAKGTGNIVIKRISDNSIIQTIDVTTAAVVVSSSTATVTINALAASTEYYVEVSAGAFTDIALNAFAGITGNSTWNFTTAAPPAAGIVGTNYDFANCTTTFNAQGWSSFSVTGPSQQWTCVSPGRAAAPDFAVQMNAFVASNNNPLNEDWLISPVYNLSAVANPVLRFYSKGDFNGNSLQLKISSNYVSGTNPNTATWTNLNGNFPANVAAQGAWTISDNIDLAAFNTAGINVAWVYSNPTTTASSRWSIDDVIIYNAIVLPPCVEPTSQPTNLVLTPSPFSVAGTFTTVASPTTVQNYLVVRATSATLTALPVDGTTYAIGSVVNSGNGTAVAISDDGSFVDNSVAPSTSYFYFVFSMEDQNCTVGPNYLQDLPLTGPVTTPAVPPCTSPTAAPTALMLTANNTSISGTFTAATGANSYLTIISTTSTLSASPVDGTAYVAGTAFGGGTVVKFGAGTNFVATGLTPATTYYLFVFAANNQCTGEPFYNTTPYPSGPVMTTNAATGIPTGYYDAAAGLNCQPLKTSLKNIITSGANVLTYTPGLWNLYQYSDLHRNDANTADIIWDMYSDNPTGPEPYTYTYGTNQCGTYANEGDCYNREHSTPQSFFASASPMVSDAHHIFPTDGKVNGVRSNFPYGEVTTATSTSLNGSKLGTGSNFGYGGTVFEPIDAYKGDFARAGLYMATRYEDQIIADYWSAKGTANALFLSTTDEPDPVKRRLMIYDEWQLKTLLKWHTQDPVSQKEIDRNNAVYYQAVNIGSGTVAQNNRNPFVDHPEYVAAMYQCTGLLPVTITSFTGQQVNDNVLLRWNATFETSFKQYEIERSVEGNNFVKIGTVLGQNLANYNFTDNSAKGNPILYYRLKMIDIDGRFKYSSVVAVRFGTSSNSTLVFPNPTNGFTKLSFAAPLLEASQITVYDFSGRLVKQSKIAIGTTTSNLDLSGLAAGKYAIKIVNSKQVINETVVVTK